MKKYLIIFVATQFSLYNKLQYNYYCSSGEYKGIYFV